MAMKRTGRGTFTGASLVPAALCDACGTTMKPASSTEWKCGNKACPEFDKKINTGVYPVREVQK